ncbi:MAG: thermonuclease family protein, partial [Alphaproteobacteria bacterium]
DSIELIEGTVVIAAEFDRRIYLNFGEDWRQDVTVTVSPNNRAIFREAGLDFAELEGKRIRVRGWTQWYNGPVIEIDHPEQIEVFEQ